MGKSGHLRGLAVDASGCVHVADKHADTIWHYCPGSVDTMTKIKAPIDLTVDGETLYVGSFSSKHPAVFALDLASPPDSLGKRVVRNFTHPTLLHPAGLLVNAQKLYVLEQTRRALLAFHADSGEYDRTILTLLPDAPEKILLVNEC